MQNGVDLQASATEISIDYFSILLVDQVDTGFDGSQIILTRWCTWWILSRRWCDGVGRSWIRTNCSI